MIARLIAPELSDSLRPPVVADNKPGASANIDAEFVARAAPDGYIVLFGINQIVTFNPHIYPRLAYDLLADLLPIAQTSVAGYILTVNNAVRPSFEEGTHVTQAIEIASGSLAYRFDGAEAAPVVMFANSLAADLRMWDDNVPAFTAAGFRVLRYDMRGHGASSGPPGDYTPELLAGDATQLLDELGIARVHFIGLSLGGIVGQQLGARYGARLSSLVLCDTMSQQAAPAAWADRIAAVRRGGMQAVLDSTLERWITPAYAAANPQRLASIREMILRTQPGGYAGCAAAVRDLQQTALLGSIRVPTLVLTGDQDKAAPPEVARRLHEQVGGSRFHIVANAAHLSNIDQAQAFNAAVLAFLTS